MRIFTPLHRGMTISVHEKNTQAMTWSRHTHGWEKKWLWGKKMNKTVGIRWIFMDFHHSNAEWLDPSRCSKPSHSMAELAEVGHRGISLTFPAQSRGRAKTAVGLSCRLWWQWGRDMWWWHLSRLRAVQKPSIKSLPILRAYRCVYLIDPFHLLRGVTFRVFCWWLVHGNPSKWWVIHNPALQWVNGVYQCWVTGSTGTPSSLGATLANWQPQNTSSIQSNLRCPTTSNNI
jgi:hypothetical protein